MMNNEVKVCYTINRHGVEGAAPEEFQCRVVKGSWALVSALITEVIDFFRCLSLECFYFVPAWVFATNIPR